MLTVWASKLRADGPARRASWSGVLGLEAAKALGVRYEQNAIVWKQRSHDRRL